jgi:hypothetical protein
MQIHVERASQEDLPAIWETDPLASSQPERRTWLMQAVEQRICLVAKLGWAVKGFVVRIEDFFGYPLIRQISVAKSAPIEDTIKALLAYIEKTSTQDRLFVALDVGDTQGQALLVALGYQSCGEVAFIGEGDVGKMFLVKTLR